MTDPVIAPTVSVVMPMYNAERHIERCLAPLLAMQAVGEVGEIIVVSDCATDRSEELVRAHAEVRLLRTPRQGGPAFARNLGVEAAAGDYIWFVDSDVVLSGNAASVLRSVLTKERPAAVIGSYDDSPDAANFLSQYKNLVHHYYHQRGLRRASTFWAGCGALSRELFRDLGGFDAVAYPYPSIEDIELGYRIVAAGGAIVLERDLQGKHLKVWRFANLMHTEIFRRAIPWSRLMLSRRTTTRDLNVSRGERVRAALACLTAVAMILFLAGVMNGWGPAVLLAACAAANLEVTRFFLRKRGAWFALRAYLLHQIYYLYSAASYVIAWMQLRLRPRALSTGRAPPPA